MSTNTGTAPRSTKALAVEAKVYEGMITSSPGPTPASSALISSAAVHEWVSSAFLQPMACSSCAWQRRVKLPSPASMPLA